MTIADLFAAFSDFAFMRRALAGCLVLSVAAAPVGVFLMLRRLSLTGDAMAHAILPGVAAGYLLAGLNLWAMTAGGLAAALSEVEIGDEIPVELYKAVAEVLIFILRLSGKVQ